jgi:flagellar hook-length control protein FliK
VTNVASAASAPAAPAVATTQAPVAPPVPPAPAPSPAHQLLSVLRPLRKFADGSHRLSVKLTPDELGSVTVELSLRSGTLSLHMVAEHSSTGDLLHDSMHELRRDLEQGGVRTGSFEVGQHASNRRDNSATPARQSTRSMSSADNSTTIDLTTPVHVNATGSATSRLDVRI